MGYVHGLIVLLLYTVWPPQTAAVFDAWLVPTRVSYGLTEDFAVNCTFEVGPATNISEIVILTILRHTQFDPDFHILASIDGSAGGFVTIATTEDVKTSALIDVRDISYLSMSWRFPAEEQIGDYRCQARGFNAQNGLVVLEKTITATGSYPERDVLINKIVALDVAARKREEMLNLEIEKLERRVDILKNVLFSKAFAMNGKTYYLSRVPYSTDDEAIASCSVFGGYLAELNNAEEHQALITHLQETLGGVVGGGVDAIVLGGSDEIREGHWVFQYSGRPMLYTDWIPGEPNDGVRYNCLALWRDDNYKMADFPCENINYRALYVCETV